MFKDISLIISTIILTGIVQSAVYAADSDTIKGIAKQTTVKFQGIEQGTTIVGSGVIISKVGDRYKVLTACHVVKIRSGRGCIETNISQQYKIHTADGQKHTPIAQTLRTPSSDSDTDLVTIEFASDRSYSLAKLGNSDQLSIDNVVYTAGFPGNSKASGYIAPGFNSSKAGQFYFPPAGNINARRPQQTGTKGYTLSYNSLTLRGMSGGPVFNELGEVIAIHGQGGIASITSSALTTSSPTPIVYSYKTNRNWGIPINTYLTEFLNQPLSTKVPAKAEILYTQGVAKLDNLEANESQIASSIPDFNQAITLQPNYASAYIARGDARFLQVLRSANIEQTSSQPPNSNLKFSEQDYLLITKDYTSAIKINPRDAYAYSNRAVAKFLFAQIHLIPILTCLASSNSANCSLDIQTLQKIQRIIVEAEQDFGKAIEILPNYALPYAFQGSTLIISSLLEQKINSQSTAVNSATLDKALAAVNTAISLDPNQEFMYSYRSTIFFLKGDNVNGSKDSRQALLLRNQQRANSGSEVREVSPYLDAFTQIQEMIDDTKDLEAIRLMDNKFGKPVTVTYKVLYLMDIQIKAITNTDYQRKYISNALASSKTLAQKSYFQGIYSLIIDRNVEKSIEDFNQAIQLDPAYAAAYIARNYISINARDASSLPDLRKAASLFKTQGDTIKYSLTMEIIESLQ